MEVISSLRPTKRDENASYNSVGNGNQSLRRKNLFSVKSKEDKGGNTILLIILLSSLISKDVSYC